MVHLHAHYILANELHPLLILTDHFWTGVSVFALCVFIDMHNYVGVFFSCISLGCRNTLSSTTTNVYNVNSSQPLASYNLSSLSSGAAAGAGAGAITMAAAQAVQATAQVLHVYSCFLHIYCFWHLVYLQFTFLLCEICENIKPKIPEYYLL